MNYFTPPQNTALAALCGLFLLNTLPKNKAGEAVHYTLTLWTKLTLFIEHPVLELSNDLAENSMRPITIVRRNWLHQGSKETGPKIAAIFSVVESCRRLNITIRKYLRDILPGLADRSLQSMEQFTPTAYAAKSGVQKYMPV